MKTPWGGIPFPKTVRAKPRETVVFAYIVFTSRKHRDQVNAKVMKNPFMSASAHKNEPMPLIRSEWCMEGSK